MTTKRIADDITVNLDTSEILIDGIPFPYHVAEAPEVEVMRGEVQTPVVLNIKVITNGLRLVREGKEHILVEVDARGHSEWARRRAHEIVLEGLSDVIVQLAAVPNPDLVEAMVDLELLDEQGPTYHDGPLPDLKHAHTSGIPCAWCEAQIAEGKRPDGVWLSSDGKHFDVKDSGWRDFDRRKTPLTPEQLERIMADMDYVERFRTVDGPG